MTAFYIVTPVRNGVQFLNTAITHIVSQAGNFEIFYHIQDGASTDGTLELIQRWEHLLAEDCPLVQCNKVHFSWASELDTGIYDAINKGFSKLDIPDDGIMGWCNADDMYMPMAFDCLTKVLMDIESLDFVTGRWLRYDIHNYNESIYHGGIYPREIMRRGCCDTRLWTSVAQPSTFWKKSLWDKTGSLNADLKLAGDYDLWCRFAEKTECAYLPVVLSLCLCHDAQMGSAKPSHGTLSYYQIEQESIRPIKERLKFIKNMWDKRLSPPKGIIIKQFNGVFSAEWHHGWPASWGTTWKSYFLRRYLYQKIRMVQFLQEVFKKN